MYEVSESDYEKKKLENLFCYWLLDMRIISTSGHFVVWYPSSSQALVVSEFVLAKAEL